MPHVQRQPQCRHVVAVAAQYFFGQWQENSFFGTCVGLVTLDQQFKVHMVQGVGMALDEFFQTWL